MARSVDGFTLYNDADRVNAWEDDEADRIIVHFHTPGTLSSTLRIDRRTAVQLADQLYLLTRTAP